MKPELATHIIYHIVGYKFGCTNNIKYRIAEYKRRGFTSDEIEIVEVLLHSTAQEAGDREMALNIQYGYGGPQLTHYAHSSRAYLENTTPEQRSAYAKKAILTRHANLTPEQRSANARIGAIGLNASLTPEQRSANARKAAFALNANLTPEQRSASARNARSARQVALSR